MLQSQQGVVSFFIGQHPIVTCGVYMGVTMVCFQGLRGVLARPVFQIESLDDYNGKLHSRTEASGEPRWQGLAKHAALNGCCGGVATLFGSTFSYATISRFRYRNTTGHTNTVERGLIALLRKEVPMAAATFYTFTLINGLVSPNHVHGGFGY